MLGRLNGKPAQSAQNYVSIILRIPAAETIYRGVTPTQPIHFTEGEDESLPPAGCNSIVTVFKLSKPVPGNESTAELWEELTEERAQRSLQNSPQRLPLQTGL